MQFLKKHLSLIALFCLPLLLSGCLVSPVSESGGMGSVTVINSNPDAIIAALQNIFPQYGYTVSRSNYPDSVSFNKDCNKITNVLWGSYGQPQTLHVKVSIIPVPGTKNYRLSPKASTITSQGEAGFESKRPLVGLWNGQFQPVLDKVSDQASGAGGL